MNHQFATVEPTPVKTCLLQSMVRERAHRSPGAKTGQPGVAYRRRRQLTSLIRHQDRRTSRYRCCRALAEIEGLTTSNADDRTVECRPAIYHHRRHKSLARVAGCFMLFSLNLPANPQSTCCSAHHTTVTTCRFRHTPNPVRQRRTRYRRLQRPQHSRPPQSNWCERRRQFQSGIWADGLSWISSSANSRAYDGCVACGLRDTTRRVPRGLGSPVEVHRSAEIQSSGTRPTSV
jgi:hypothetical protein